MLDPLVGLLNDFFTYLFIILKYFIFKFILILQNFVFEYNTQF